MRIDKVRPSAVLAAIALVVACAGGGYAAAKIDTKQLANKAVTKPKLARGERSEGFIANVAAQLAMPASTSTVVAKLKLPNRGKFLVSATTSLGNSQAGNNFVSCELRDGQTLVTQGWEGLPPVAAFGASITLQGTSDGGVVTLACNPSQNGVARERVITATRVGTLRTK